MRCEKCGSENQDGSKYCSACGACLNTFEKNGDNKKTYVESKNNYDLKNAKTRSKSRTKKILLGGLILAVVVGIGSFAAIRVVKNEQYKEALADAEQYIEEKDFDKAEMSYCEAVEIFPEGTKAKEALLNLYIQNAENALHDANLTNAEENCEKALNLQSDNEKANLLLGNIYEKQYKMSSAESLYEKILVLNPDSAEAYVRLMRIKATRDEFEDVEKMLEKVVDSSISEQAVFEKYLHNYENYMRYKAYNEKLSEFNSVKESGSYKEGDGWEQTYGCCFFKLVDFDENGTDEMIIAYTESPYTMDTRPNYISDYVLEVWAFENGKLEKVFTGTPLMSGTVDTVSLEKKDNQWYLQTGASGADRDTTFYKYEENKFVPVMTTEINSATLEMKINGETVSSETWDNTMAQYDKEEYLLQGYNTRNGDSYTYVNAFDEYRRSECKLSYLRRACYHSIVNAEVEGGKSGIKSGNYAYRSDEMDMYVSSYQFGEYGEEPKIYVTYYREGKGRSSFYFTWDEKTGYVSESDVEMSYEQKDDILSISIQEKYEDEAVSAKLQRETQYDMDS